MTYCKSCGSAMEDSHLICQNCGTKKGLGTAFCDKCGAVRQVGMAFCQECGNQLNDQQAAPATGSVPYAQQTAAQQNASIASQNNSQYLPQKKYCRNCGSQVMNNQVICTKCGVKVGEGNSYCMHCAAPVTNPQAIACTSCGMSLKPPFDLGKYANQFVDNFTGIFKTNDTIGMLLEYGANFLSLLTFIFSFLPITYIYVGGSYYYYSQSESESYNIFQNSGFAGFLLIIALLVSIARFVPHVKEFGEKNKNLEKFFVFATPAFMLVSTIILVLHVAFGSAVSSAASGSYYGISLESSYGFTFLGVVFLILVVLSIASAVFSFLRKEGIVKF